MDWDDLRFFLALARAGTLSAAAEQLGVSHTTVSRRVAALSDARAPLFLKTPDGYALTALGERLQGVCDRLETEAVAAERLLTGEDPRLAGRLVVTTIDAFVRPFAPVFARFAERHPAVDLVVSVDNRAVSLTRREADVALRFTNTPPEHLVGRRLRHCHWAPCASPELIDRIGCDAPLSAYPWLGWVEPHAKLTEAWIDAQTGRSDRIARVDTASSLFTLMQAGLGAAPAAVDIAAFYGLQPLGPVIEDFGVDVWVLTHPDLQHAARVRAFLDLAADSMPLTNACPP